MSVLFQPILEVEGCKHRNKVKQGQLSSFSRFTSNEGTLSFIKLSYLNMLNTEFLTLIGIPV
jgi:hypothetical protein